MFKKKLGFLLMIMLVLSLGGYAVCSMAGTKQLEKEDDFLLVTSFYPMYILAQNLTEHAEGITVSNLTENQTGCLHDYQLTSGDMKLLSAADAFLINGAGMELFVEKILENYENLPVIDASEGITLLEGVGHHSHDHEEEEEEHDHPAEEEHAHTHSHEENGHVWMDVHLYRIQLQTVATQLKQLVPEQSGAIETAYKAYDAELEELFRDMQYMSLQTEGTPVVIFHEAFAYFAEELQMEVLAVLSLDEETVPSAGEIAEVIEEIKYHGSALILIEEQYGEHARKIMEETDATVVYLNPLVTGDGSAHSYVREMQNNLEALKSAIE